MEKNGNKSCTGNSRHIDIWYYFVKDCIDSGNISITYYITEHMLEYFFTKYLQGYLCGNFMWANKLKCGMT